jgi:hypothetical protein
MKYLFAFATLAILIMGIINIFYTVWPYSSADALLVLMLLIGLTKISE